jgi:hypothetical protein
MELMELMQAKNGLRERKSVGRRLSEPLLEQTDDFIEIKFYNEIKIKFEI